MRPATRITCLLVVVAVLPFLPATMMFGVLAVAVLSLLVVPGSLRAHILLGLRRVRWLLAAILFLYLFLAPGAATTIPWVEALARCAVLLCAVTAVQIALYGIPAAALAQGLTQVLTPLAWVGLPTETFARRLTLTLEAVPEIQRIIAETPVPEGGNAVSRIADRAAAVIMVVERA